jgi:phenylpropionate dioxygenase-like ring-hydroxylating dioxygenase large terminal subunit
VPWVEVLRGDDVLPGSVAGVEVGDEQLVVWRAESGTLAACDARCPHQWSHLAEAGVVAGEELVCLSHLWRFDPCGRGSKVSVKGRRDPKGDVPTWPVREVDGAVEVHLPSGPR